MKINVGAHRKLGGHVPGEPGPLELLRPPPLDDLLLGLLEGGVRSRHLDVSSLVPLSTPIRYNAQAGSPYTKG